MKIPNKRELQQIVSNHSSDIDFKEFLKLYKDYTKETYPFLVNDTTLSSNNPLRFRKKAINSKIEQNKAQHNLDRKTAKISALSSGAVSKYEFLTGKDVLPEKDLLEKAATMKRFEYSPLSKELKKQTSVGEKQYQDFDKVFNHDGHEKPVKNKGEEPLITNESSLFYDNKYSFSEFTPRLLDH